MADELTIPGDKVATIEEYLPGENTFEDGETIRSSSIGIKELNRAEQQVSIQNKTSIGVPKIGDIIIGTVEATLGSMIAVSIGYINGTKIESNIELKNVFLMVWEATGPWGPKRCPGSPWRLQKGCPWLQ